MSMLYGLITPDRTLSVLERAMTMETTICCGKNASSVSPQLTATGSNVYVVWTDDTTGNADINFRKSSDYRK
jgi:hypothetical protein